MSQLSSYGPLFFVFILDAFAHFRRKRLCIYLHIICNVKKNTFRHISHIYYHCLSIHPSLSLFSWTLSKGLCCSPCFHLSELRKLLGHINQKELRRSLHYFQWQKRCTLTLIKTKNFGDNRRDKFHPPILFFFLF